MAFGDLGSRPPRTTGSEDAGHGTPFGFSIQYAKIKDVSRWR